MAREIGLRLPVIIDENRKPTLYSAIRHKGSVPFALIFNPYSDNVMRGNYFDIYLNLIHEKNHVDTPENTNDKMQSEYEAYEEVLLHPYYKYASNEYKRNVESSINDYGSKMRRSGVIIGNTNFR
jgi:hypothetical protein